MVCALSRRCLGWIAAIALGPGGGCSAEPEVGRNVVGVEAVAAGEVPRMNKRSPPVLAASIVEEPSAASYPARVTYQGSGEERRVALTFDDGPSPYTSEVLRILRDHGARATFFALGSEVEKRPKTTAAIVRQGHEVANHGYSHRSFRGLFRSQIRSEVLQTEELVEAVTGKRPRLLRPPYGRFTESALLVLGGLDVDVVLWSADGEDWGASADGIVETLKRELKPGAIILLHDSKQVTVDALPRLLKTIAGRGYRIVPVSELLGVPAYRDG